MRLKLTVKLADVVEGVDLSRYSEGDVIELSDQDAQLLLAGGLAERIGNEERVSSFEARRSAVAAERSRP